MERTVLVSLFFNSFAPKLEKAKTQYFWEE